MERSICIREECTLNEIVYDISCSLNGRFCAQNMIFVLIKRSEYQHCIVLCKCAEGYKEENGQCIGQHEKTRQHGRRTKNIVSFKTNLILLNY